MIQQILRYLVFAVLCVSCSNQPTQLGGGTGHEGETKTVAISGIVLDINNSPAVNVPVSLLPKYYLSLTDGQLGLAKTVTDANGTYTFSTVPAGSYAVQARDSTGQTLTIPVEVSVSTQTITVREEKLQPPSAVRGQIIMADTLSSVQIGMYGIDMEKQSVRSGESFFFADIPAGNWTVLVAGTSGYLATTREITTSPGDTTILDPITLDPYGCPDFTCDSLVLRAILDTNGLRDVAVDTSVVVKSASGRARQVFLERISFLPDTIAMLRTMEELFITNAPSFDTLPPVIGRITNVHKLFMFKTGLRYIAPDVGRMYKLRDLVLINGELERLPVEIMQCNRLGTNRFWLSNNHLVDVPEDLQSWIDSRTDQPDWRDSQTPPE